MCIHLDTCKFDLGTPVVYLYTICINRIISYIFIHMCMKWDPHLWEKTCLHMKRHLYLAKDTYILKKKPKSMKRDWNSMGRTVSALQVAISCVAHVHARTHAHPHTPTHTHLCRRTHLLTHIHGLSIYMYTYEYIYIYTYALFLKQHTKSTCAHTYIYTRTHTYAANCARNPYTNMQAHTSTFSHSLLIRTTITQTRTLSRFYKHVRMHSRMQHTCIQHTDTRRHKVHKHTNAGSHIRTHINTHTMTFAESLSFSEILFLWHMSTQTHMHTHEHTHPYTRHIHTQNMHKHTTHVQHM